MRQIEYRALLILAMLVVTLVAVFGCNYVAGPEALRCTALVPQRIAYVSPRGDTTWATVPQWQHVRCDSLNAPR